ncbi:nicotinate-nucleotide adenylyltransferase [Tunturibacter empetritectus]|uniref:Probable nicotinate-nucleotide adenylyltransferase n=1 Tax=Tunturiibacter empetritectus TaxID=3069691 RepID=A0A7W8II20_9BACT|nr:nicotinate-nucleotide adenylyltransferase [Edaphobacter lichenicola]MBB5317559.1 nicotinate-nucleotide adenylyltransferase [Edaphobacter lichenicola]
MRVALFGGSFDPPHHGHLAIATAAADGFALNSVFFAPAGRQPLKLDDTVTSFEDRLAMVELACLEDPRFEASELDAPRADGAPNYTVETLSELAQRMPEAKLFNLVGADSFLSLPRWHEPERLLELAEWIVVSRPGFPIENLSSLGLDAHQQSRVHLLGNVHDNTAATGLRERLEAGDPCVDLIAPGVLDYIQRHNLYL